MTKLIHYQISHNLKSRLKIMSLASCLIYFSSCGGGPQQGAGAAGAPQVQPFAVFKVIEQNAPLHTNYPATLQGQQNIEIRPKIDGYIENIFIDEGSAVKKGQLMFTISAPQYQQNVNNAKAAISSAEADVGAAQLQVDKVKPLVEKDIISEFELESARYTLQARRAALAQAKANLANSQTNLAYTRVTSPVNGVVGSIPYKLGSLVSSNTTQPLTTVSNIGNIYAYFSLNEKQLLEFARKYQGKTLEEKIAKLAPVTLVLSDGSDYPEKGRVETISGLINTETGSVSFRATFPNPLNMIRSGGSATVRLPQDVTKAILIPQKATFELQGKRFVYVADANGKVKSTEVELMQLAAGQFFVVTNGLKPGDNVLMEGGANLPNGTVIKPEVQAEDKVYQGLK